MHALIRAFWGVVAVLLGFLVAFPTWAQQTPDSVRDNAKNLGAAPSAEAATGQSGFANIDGTRLAPATLSYDITVKARGRSLDLTSTRTIAATTTNGTDTWTLVGKTKTPQGTVTDSLIADQRGRSLDLTSTRTIAATTTNGTDTWTLVGKTKTPQGTVTDSLIADRRTLLPRSRHQRGPFTIDVTFTDTSASGQMTMRGRSTPLDTRLDGPTLAGGVHDLIALGTMALEPGFSTTLRVFSAQKQEVRAARFEVTGTDTVKTPAGSFEAYAVDVDVGGGDVTGTVHLRTDAPHYIVKSTTEVSTQRGSRTVIQKLSAMEAGSPSATRSP